MSMTLVFAAVLAVITVTIGRIRWLERILPVYRWGSLAAGVSTAYVFVELLPELTHADYLLQSFLPHFAYVLALGGLVLFYILDVLAQESRTRGGGTSAGVFRVHIGFIAAYHFLIGELLVDIAGHGLAAALIFCVVLIYHFYIMDNARGGNRRDVGRGGGGTHPAYPECRASRQ